MLASMLESGAWNVRSNELAIEVAASSALIEMSAGADARRLIIAAASGVLGRPVKLQITPGRSAPPPAAKPPSNGSGRSRVEQEPVVQRMKEKFGAEIRTVIDYRKGN